MAATHKKIQQTRSGYTLFIGKIFDKMNIEGHFFGKEQIQIVL